MEHEENPTTRYGKIVHHIAHARHLAHDGLVIVGAIDVGGEILHLAVEHIRLILGG